MVGRYKRLIQFLATKHKRAAQRIVPILAGSFLLLAASGLPAVVQLAIDEFTPPIAVPFGVTMDDVRKETANVIWIDARPAEAFAQAHVSGSLNLNRNNWQAGLPHLFEIYSPGKIVIVYCSVGCTESEEIADRIRELGFEPVNVLEGGFEAWQKGNHSP